MNLHRTFGRVTDGTRFLDSEERAKRETDDDLSTARAQASFNGGKIPLDRFAPRARAFHWGGRAPLFARVPLEISLG